MWLPFLLMLFLLFPAGLTAAAFISMGCFSSPCASSHTTTPLFWKKWPHFLWLHILAVLSRSISLVKNRSLACSRAVCPGLSLFFLSSAGQLCPGPVPISVCEKLRTFSWNTLFCDQFRTERTSEEDLLHAPRDEAIRNLWSKPRRAVFLFWFDFWAIIYRKGKKKGVSRILLSVAGWHAGLQPSRTGFYLYCLSSAVQTLPAHHETSTCLCDSGFSSVASRFGRAGVC